jgi:hypothetical protein
MPEWLELVRLRLTGLALEKDDLAQVVEELAGHLDDQYQSLLDKGISEQTATKCVLQQVMDWGELKSKIESSRLKEQTMNKRVSQFWFPAFLTILLAMSFLMIVEALGFEPWVSSAWGGPQGTVPVARCRRVSSLAHHTAVHWCARGLSFGSRWRSTLGGIRLGNVSCRSLLGFFRHWLAHHSGS